MESNCHITSRCRCLRPKTFNVSAPQRQQPMVSRHTSPESPRQELAPHTNRWYKAVLVIWNGKKGSVTISRDASKALLNHADQLLYQLFILDDICVSECSSLIIYISSCTGLLSWSASQRDHSDWRLPPTPRLWLQPLMLRDTPAQIRATAWCVTASIWIK